MEETDSAILRRREARRAKLLNGGSDRLSRITQTYTDTMITTTMEGTTTTTTVTGKGTDFNRPMSSISSLPQVKNSSSSNPTVPESIPLPPSTETMTPSQVPTSNSHLKSLVSSSSLQINSALSVPSTNSSNSNSSSNNSRISSRNDSGRVQSTLRKPSSPSTLQRFVPGPSTTPLLPWESSLLESPQEPFTSLLKNQGLSSLGSSNQSLLHSKTSFPKSLLLWNWIHTLSILVMSWFTIHVWTFSSQNPSTFDLESEVGENWMAWKSAESWNWELDPLLRLLDTSLPNSIRIGPWVRKIS